MSAKIENSCLYQLPREQCFKRTYIRVYVYIYRLCASRGAYSQQARHSRCSHLVAPTVMYLSMLSRREGEAGRCGAFDILRLFFQMPHPGDKNFGQNRSNIPTQNFYSVVL